ncbi:MAG: hypothetical protein HYV07_08695 [Deltaproteobacteria bacterium]|nr:hypothetical protein [Deltaproteobacteria bacterium]
MRSRVGWIGRCVVVAIISATASCATFDAAPSGYYASDWPPEALIETIPSPIPGYAWLPGYWELSAGGWIWVPGRLYPIGHATLWVPPRCANHRGRCWYTPGHWEGGRSHDRPRSVDRRADAVPRPLDRPRMRTPVRTKNEPLGAVNRTPSAHRASAPATVPTIKHPPAASMLSAPTIPFATQVAPKPSLVPANGQAPVVPPVLAKRRTQRPK